MAKLVTALRPENLIPAAAATTFFFFFFFFFTTPSLSSSSATNELVNQVCNRTRHYRYCIDVLYSDPRTPNADTHFLAYIAFTAAYNNATDTQDYLRRLRNDGQYPSLVGAKVFKGVETCMASYARAVSALESAYDDLSSESYGQLGHLSRAAGLAGFTCQRAVGGAVTVPVTLSVRNRDMKRLSGICIVISNMLNDGT